MLEYYFSEVRMKHFLTFALLLLLTGAMLVACIGCGKTQDPTPAETEAGSETVPSTPLIEDGVFKYTVIRNDMLSSESAETKAAVKLRTALGRITGADVKIKTDFDPVGDDVFEILVGTTKRDATRKYLDGLTADDFVLANDGHKIVITGGSEKAISYAVDLFLTLYCGYVSETNFTPNPNLSIPEDLYMKDALDFSTAIALWSMDGTAPYMADLTTALKQQFPGLQEFSGKEGLASALDANSVRLAILGDIAHVPAGSMTYLESGGRLLLLGGPAFGTELYELNGNWVTQSEYMLAQINDLDPDEKQLIYSTEDPTIVNKFQRSTNTSQNKVTLTVDDYGLTGSDAQLCIDMAHLDGWEVLNYDFRDTLEDAAAIGFFGRGDAATSTSIVYVEISETDGTRWYSVPALSDDWSFIVLSPRDFTWWDGVTTKKGGTPDLSKIRRIGFGLAQSGAATAVGPHVMYISDPTLLTLDPSLVSTAPPAIDGVSPEYEVFPVTNAANLKAADNQIFVSTRNYTVPSSVISCHPGRQGLGYGMNRVSRFIPLIEIFNAKGLHSGYAAWIDLFSGQTAHNKTIENSAVGCFTATSADFYDANGLAAVCEAAKALCETTLLVEGGSDEHIYVASDTDAVNYGASLVSVKGMVDTDPNLSLSVTLYAGEEKLDSLTSAPEGFKALKNNVRTISGNYKISGKQPDRAVTELTRGGKVIDRIEQSIRFWSPRPESERKYIYSEDGYFKRDGKILSFFGVNYMPSSGIAEPVGSIFEHYVSREAYDPDVIEKDLDHLVDVGFNAVSIFVYVNAIETSNNILDLIEKCADRGIYVDLSIRPYCYPVKGYNAGSVKTLMTKLHFKDNENIIAYDIAWEPQLGNYTDGSVRKAWDADWTEWLKVQYGSLEKADAALGVKLTRTSVGTVLAPSDTQLDSNSPTYKELNNAYSRFIDDQVGQIFLPRINEMREHDPNHLISFRMANAGSAFVAPSNYAYDFQSLKAAVDILEPEGYALSADTTRILQVDFASAYARYTNPDKPLVWKEYGRHIWSGSNFNPSEGLEEGQYDYYEAVLSHALNNSPCGMYCWYYAGGFRIGENSDYGILNPDGSDRLVTVLLREYAPKFIGQGERNANVSVITVERDDYTNHLTGMIDAITNKLSTAYLAGKRPVFVTKQQSDPGQVFYADTVADIPTGAKAGTEGDFPLRYVNGIIRKTEYVGSGAQTVLRVTLTNTHFAAWRKDTVSIVSVAGPALEYTIGQDVLSGQTVTVDIPVSGPAEYQLRFSVGGHRFGPVYGLGATEVTDDASSLLTSYIKGVQMTAGEDLISPHYFDPFDASKYSKLILKFHCDKQVDLSTAITGGGQFELSSDPIGDTRETHWGSADLLKTMTLDENGNGQIELVFSEGSYKSNLDEAGGLGCDFGAVLYFRWYLISQTKPSTPFTLTLTEARFE